MTSLRHIARALSVMLMLVTPSLVTADSMMKHSGTVVDLDRAVGKIVLAEVGPWRLERGETVLTRRTIDVTKDTSFALVRRVEAAPSGFRNDFVEEKLDGATMATGDYVTVDCLHRAGRLIALKVTVVELER